MWLIYKTFILRTQKTFKVKLNKRVYKYDDYSCPVKTKSFTPEIGSLILIIDRIMDRTKMNEERFDVTLIKVESRSTQAQFIAHKCYDKDHNYDASVYLISSIQ